MWHLLARDTQQASCRPAGARRAHPAMDAGRPEARPKSSNGGRARGHAADLGPGTSAGMGSAQPVLPGGCVPTEIGREEVRRLVAEGAQVVDVLPSEVFADEHLAGAISLPLKTLTRPSAERLLRRDAPVVVYCNDAL
jgi:hypothetical protein